MIKAGHITINPAFVASMEWEGRWYMNGHGDSTLIIRMQDGHVHRIKHQPQYLDGVDAYQVEKAINDHHSVLAAV